MKRLTYWKDVPINGKPWATFKLVPEQTIDEHDSVYFKDIVEIVKHSDFNYQIIEITEKLVEHRRTVK